MALTEIYVDPSIAGDSGSGTIGDPYGDLEYAIEQTTFDTTNGTRINIKAGTDEVLAADLSVALADTSVSAAWAPSEKAPVVFQGYTSAAGDGGIGGISGGGGNFSIFGGSLGTQRYLRFVDLHMHNTGTAPILDVDNYCIVRGCTLNNTSGAGGIFGIHCHIIGCYFHDIGGIGIDGTTFYAFYNYLANGTKNFTVAIDVEQGVAMRNIITIDGSSHGIQAGNFSTVINNSIYSAAGTGSGIIVPNSCVPHVIINNLIEGFSGTGGFGIDFGATDSGAMNVGYNSIYNCATEVDTETAAYLAWGTNESLSASPFTDAASGDFSPVNTGSVKEGSTPSSFINS